MVMDPFDYDLGWGNDSEEEEESIQGFSVPYRFRALLPIINFVHYRVLWAKYRIIYYGAMIPEKVLLFYPNSRREDYTAEVIFFDDEEQDTYTRKLQQEDILRNEGYAKLFALLVMTPFPLFCVRLWIRFTFFDIFSLLSITLSAWSIPAVRTDSLAVILPGSWKLFFLRVNIYLAAVVTLHVMFSPPGRVVWDRFGAEILWLNDIKHFGTIPLIMALVSHSARRFMEAINMVELEHIRYSYLPRSRGGIKDVPEVPQDPPGPPPPLPSTRGGGGGGLGRGGSGAVPPRGRGVPPRGRGVPPRGRGIPPRGRGIPPRGRGIPPRGRGAPPRGDVAGAEEEMEQVNLQWTANEFGFDYDEWMLVNFGEGVKVTTEVPEQPPPLETLADILPPPIRPTSGNWRETAVHYAACLQWQLENWPALLRQRVLLPQTPLQVLSQVPQFLATWALLQNDEWESFRQLRDQLAIEQQPLPEIPPPPQSPQDANREQNVEHHQACLQWHRTHWKMLLQQRGRVLLQLVAPVQNPPPILGRRTNVTLLTEWELWLRDEWAVLQQQRTQWALNQPQTPVDSPQERPKVQESPPPKRPRIPTSQSTTRYIAACLKWVDKQLRRDQEFLGSKAEAALAKEFNSYPRLPPNTSQTLMEIIIEARREGRVEIQVGENLVETALGLLRTSEVGVQ